MFVILQISTTYFHIFHFTKHYDDFNILFTDHCPEIFDCINQGMLGGYKPYPFTITLLEKSAF